MSPLLSKAIVRALDPKQLDMDPSLVQRLPEIHQNVPVKTGSNGEKHIHASNTTTLGLGVVGVTINHIGSILCLQSRVQENVAEVC